MSNRGARLTCRKERLELVDRERPAARVALELIDVGDEVALAKLPGSAAELALADHRPRVAPITRVLREALQPLLVARSVERASRSGRVNRSSKYSSARDARHSHGQHPTCSPNLRTPRSLSRIDFGFR